MFFAAVVLSMPTVFVGDDAGRLRAESPDRPAPPPVRGFYMPSYDVNALIDESNEAQLDAFRAQVASASHAVLAVHVRVPSGIRSNTVTRDGISEDPSHLVPWFDLAKKKGLRVGLIAILFSDGDWGWGGYWQPTNPAAALASYYSAIQPYLQAAQTAGADFVILCDEWSALFSSSAAVPAFRTLLKSARADCNGKIGINVNKLEEADLLPGIAALPDFIGVTADVPLSDANAPSYQEMYENLTGPSSGRQCAQPGLGESGGMGAARGTRLYEIPAPPRQHLEQAPHPDYRIQVDSRRREGPVGSDGNDGR